MTTEETKYIPFSNGTEFDHWHSRNCQQCSRYSFDGPPECEADEALTLALFDDGAIDIATCNFIGTTDRHTQVNGDGRPGYSFCDLNRVCNHFAQK